MRTTMIMYFFAILTPLLLMTSATASIPANAGINPNMDFSEIMRLSNDNGQTFGPVLNLSANGTIGSPEEDE